MRFKQQSDAGGSRRRPMEIGRQLLMAALAEPP
jgi:hypothetical protein